MNKSTTNLSYDPPDPFEPSPSILYVPDSPDYLEDHSQSHNLTISTEVEMSDDTTQESEGYSRNSQPSCVNSSTSGKNFQILSKSKLQSSTRD